MSWIAIIILFKASCHTELNICIALKIVIIIVLFPCRLESQLSLVLGTLKLLGPNITLEMI